MGNINHTIQTGGGGEEQKGESREDLFPQRNRLVRITIVGAGVEQTRGGTAGLRERGETGRRRGETGRRRGERRRREGETGRIRGETGRREGR